MDYHSTESLTQLGAKEGTKCSLKTAEALGNVPQLIDPQPVTGFRKKRMEKQADLLDDAVEVALLIVVAAPVGELPLHVRPVVRRIERDVLLE